MRKVLLSLSCLTSLGFAEISNKQKIIETVDNVGRFADEHKWDKLKNLFDDKILLDYSFFIKQEATIVTPSELVKS